MSTATWRWLWLWSGSHCPDSGLRCTIWVSSVPSLPLCHGNMAPCYTNVMVAWIADTAPRVLNLTTGNSCATTAPSFWASIAHS
jgi:hypothetical protein